VTTFHLFAEIDQAALGRLARMADPTLSLYPAMRAAMTESLDVLEWEAQQQMYDQFIETTGATENAFVKIPGTFLSILENTSDYGQRLNYGFSGKTDSLGRYYPYWPAYLWAEGAIVEAVPQVELIWDVALGRL
jgi:hypothetical protein